MTLMLLHLSVWSRCEHPSCLHQSDSSAVHRARSSTLGLHGDQAGWRHDQAWENVQMTPSEYADIASWTAQHILLLPPPTHCPSSHVVEEEGVRCRVDCCHPLPNACQSKHSKETFPASVNNPAHQPGHTHRQGGGWGADVIITR